MLPRWRTESRPTSRLRIMNKRRMTATSLQFLLLGLEGSVSVHPKLFTLQMRIRTPANPPQHAQAPAPGRHFEGPQGPDLSAGLFTEGKGWRARDDVCPNRGLAPADPGARGKSPIISVRAPPHPHAGPTKAGVVCRAHGIIGSVKHWGCGGGL